MQPLKKQCTSDVAAATTKKPKPKSSSPSKDPQSIAAKVIKLLQMYSTDQIADVAID